MDSRYFVTFKTANMSFYVKLSVPNADEALVQAFGAYFEKIQRGRMTSWEYTKFVTSFVKESNCIIVPNTTCSLKFKTYDITYVSPSNITILVDNKKKLSVREFIGGSLSLSLEAKMNLPLDYFLEEGDEPYYEGDSLPWNFNIPDKYKIALLDEEMERYWKSN